jgi:hypothetical protein
MADLDYDPGPPKAFANKFAAVPSYAKFKDHFWFDWGPVLYRVQIRTTATP